MLFMKAQGKKISKEKIKILFSKNVHHSRAIELLEVFGFSLIGDLGKYLKVPLHHKRMSSKSFSYLTEKLLKRLSC